MMKHFYRKRLTTSLLKGRRRIFLKPKRELLKWLINEININIVYPRIENLQVPIIGEREIVLQELYL